MGVVRRHSAVQILAQTDPQPSSCSKKQAFDGWDGGVENDGHFFVRQVLEFSQGDGQSLLVGQGGDGVIDGLFEFPV